MIAYEYALLRLSVLDQSVTALVLPPPCSPRDFFNSLATSNSVAKANSVTTWSCDFFGSHRKVLAPLIMKLIRKMQGKKREKSDFKGNVVPQQEQDEYTSFTADLT